MIDCIIIGSGVAGISAALTLKANGKSFLLFGSPDLSEKIEKAESVRNYPAFLGTGKEFAQALKAQLLQEEIPVRDEKVAGVYALKDKFTILTQGGESYESRTVILAVGVQTGKQIEGEENFLGRGVSYCATCDGFLYKDKTIAVLCTSKRMEHEVGFLADFAKRVYLMPLYKEVGIARENVEILRKVPARIEGARRVEKILLAGKEEAELAVDGVFLLRESVSPSTLVAGLQTEEGLVVTNRDTSTNLRGLFAAGDCTGRPFQYTKAAGEGNVAAHAVSKYLGS